MSKISFEGIWRKKTFIVTAIVLLAVVIAVFVYINREKNKVYNSYTVKNSVEIDSQISAQYKEFAGGILRYSSDGISFFKDGREVFNKAISISSPILSTCGNYIVIAERKSNEICLIDIKGNQTNLTSTYPIVDVDVSEQGVVAATLDDGNANYIELYDKENAKLVGGRTVLSGDGYPIDISIANDATRLVASYLAVSAGNAQSKVVFYNYTSVGENEVDRIVGGFNQYKSTIVPEVNFINNTTAVGVGDNMFSIYSIKQKPKLLHEEKFDEKIEAVFYSSKYIGIVFESTDSSYSQILKVYNKEGEKVFSKALDFRYNDIAFAGDNVVMYDESTCRMYSFTGKERFNYTFDKNIVKLVPVKDDKYIVVSDNSIEEIELK